MESNFQTRKKYSDLFLIIKKHLYLFRKNTK